MGPVPSFLSIRFDQRKIPTFQTDSQPTNTDEGKETHEGAGAKAAAPPMRARMARTRMVEVDGPKERNDDASEASKTKRSENGW